MLKSENHAALTVEQGPGQSIETKYLGPTNHRGARVKATCEAGSLTVPWNHALNSGRNHEAACLALAHVMLAKGGEGWAGRWVGGWNAASRACVFVRVPA